MSIIGGAACIVVIVIVMKTLSTGKGQKWQQGGEEGVIVVERGG